MNLTINNVNLAFNGGPRYILNKSINQNAPLIGGTMKRYKTITTPKTEEQNKTIKLTVTNK